MEKTVRIIFASSAYAKDSKVVIGKDGDMPWKIEGKSMVPSDMVRFKNLTKGQSLVVGRKTWDSIPENFRPFDKNLPLEESRQSIIVTRNQDFKVDNPRVMIAHSLEDAIQLARTENVWIIGGAEIYALTMPMADFLHQTLVYRKFDGDVFFPCYNRDKWRSVEPFKYFHAGCPGTENDQLDTAYLVLRRK